jgi:hypothetical protein
MDILDLLKQRLTPLYPQMAPKLPDQHDQIVAQGQQNQGRIMASLSARDSLSRRVSRAVKARDCPVYKAVGNDADGSGHKRTDRCKQVSGDTRRRAGNAQQPTPSPQQRSTHRPANAVRCVGSQPNRQHAITATWPRIADQPVTGDLGPQPQQQPAIQRALTRREKIEQDISSIEGKDYTPPVYRDPNSGETSKKAKPGYVLEKEAGKNYDKTHNILDVLKSIGLGALQGGQKGGISGNDRRCGRRRHWRCGRSKYR